MHKQFGHPLCSDKLKQLIKDAGIKNESLEKCVDKVTNGTLVIVTEKKKRPVVSFSLAKDHNEVGH